MIRATEAADARPSSTDPPHAANGTMTRFTMSVSDNSRPSRTTRPMSASGTDVPAASIVLITNAPTATFSGVPSRSILTLPSRSLPQRVEHDSDGPGSIVGRIELTSGDDLSQAFALGDDWTHLRPVGPELRP